MRVLYTVHPVRLDIGGEVSDIQGIDRDLLESCYRKFYNPANMLLIVAGDVDPDEIFRRAEALFSPSAFKALGPIGRRWPAEPAGVKERVVRSEMAVSRPRVLMGFKDLETGNGRALEREFETSVVLDLLFGRSSAFFTRAYEKGLIDDSFSFSFNSEDAFGFSLIGGETDQPEGLAEQLLLELHQAKKAKLKTADIERSKRKRLGKFIRSFDTPDGAAFLTMGSLQRGIDLFRVPQVISKMSARALEKRLNEHFDERNYAVSILNPKPGSTTPVEE